MKTALIMIFLFLSAFFLLFSHALLKKNTALQKENAELSSRITSISDFTQAKDTFLAGVSHELKTPLNTILGMTYLLHKTSLDEPQKDLLYKLENASDLLLGIIEDVLDFSKLDTPSFKLDPHPVSVFRLMQDTDDLFQTQVCSKGLTWRCHCSVPASMTLLLDKYRLHQVLINLISNSIKFTEKGFLSVDAEANFRRGDRIDLIFHIKDSGIGIPTEKRSDIFNPFAQIENPLTKNHQGTGLGLPISKKLVEAMGGTLELDSTAGGGCRFTILIPNVQITSDSGHETDSFRPKPIQTKIAPVLIVDDTAINAEIARQLLLEIGICSDIACDGTEAIRMCRHRSASHYSLILMDIHMPKLNGYDTASILKQEIGVSCPIVALTASTPESEFQTNRNIQMDGFIQKPFRAANFQKRVLSHIGIVESEYQSYLDNSVENSTVSLQKAEFRNSLNTESRDKKNILFSHEDGLAHFGGKKDLFQKYASKFCISYADADEQIKQLLNEKNTAEASRLAHSIKGLAGMLGLCALTAASEELDRAIKEDSLEKLPSCLHRFSSILKASTSSMNFSDQQSG